MKLTSTECHSAIWQKLSQYLQKELNTARRKNDCSLTELETQKLRGEIKVYKKLLAFAEEKKEIVTDFIATKGAW